jgi:hypothetical protein
MLADVCVCVNACLSSLVNEGRRDLQRTPTDFGARSPAAGDETTCRTDAVGSLFGRARGGHAVQSGTAVFARWLAVGRVVLACAGEKFVRIGSEVDTQTIVSLTMPRAAFVLGLTRTAAVAGKSVDCVVAVSAMRLCQEGDVGL